MGFPYVPYVIKHDNLLRQGAGFRYMGFAAKFKSAIQWLSRIVCIFIIIVARCYVSHISEYHCYLYMYSV